MKQDSASCEMLNSPRPAEWAHPGVRTLLSGTGGGG